MTRDAVPPPNLARQLDVGSVFGFIVVLVLMLAGDIRQVSRQVLAFRWGLFLSEARPQDAGTNECELKAEG